MSVSSLKGSRGFQRIRSEGRAIKSGCLLLRWVEDSSLKDAQFGIAVSKRVGGAVVRNRIKRRIRSAVRESDAFNGVSNGLYLLVARDSAKDAAYNELKGDLTRAVGRARVDTKVMG